MSAALMGNPKLGDDVSAIRAQLYPLLANRYYFGVKNLFWKQGRSA